MGGGGGWSLHAKIGVVQLYVLIDSENGKGDQGDPTLAQGGGGYQGAERNAREVG